MAAGVVSAEPRMPARKVGFSRRFDGPTIISEAALCHARPLRPASQRGNTCLVRSKAVRNGRFGLTECGRVDMADLVDAVWRKSTYSAVNGCVEIAFLDGIVAVRDSKNQQGQALIFTPVEWQAFVNGVRDGQFDLP